jgi:hypothetical protein
MWYHSLQIIGKTAIAANGEDICEMAAFVVCSFTLFLSLINDLKMKDSPEAGILQKPC